VWLPDGEQILKICLFVLTECTNVTHTHTHMDRQTDTHTTWQHRPRLHSIARQKLSQLNNTVFSFLNCAQKIGNVSNMLSQCSVVLQHKENKW